MSAILVVDDEAAMRQLYRRILLNQSSFVLEARTAEEALDLLAISDIDVVVADLHMPGQGGEWLVGQLQTRFPHVRVILATGDESLPGTLTMQSSIVSYIVKPISPAALLAAVDAALSRQPAPADVPTPADGDAIEAFLDSKLNRGHGDGGNQ